VSQFEAEKKQKENEETTGKGPKRYSSIMWYSTKMEKRKEKEG